MYLISPPISVMLAIYCGRVRVNRRICSELCTSTDDTNDKRACLDWYTQRTNLLTLFVVCLIGGCMILPVLSPMIKIPFSLTPMSRYCHKMDRVIRVYNIIMLSHTLITTEQNNVICGELIIKIKHLTFFLVQQ
jgi:hypothetical protein